MKKTILLFLAFVLILSCSKNETEEPITLSGGEIFRSQVVVIDFPDTNLTENDYQATLGDVVITVSRAEDSKLIFLVPYSTSPGMKDLVIPSLNNATIHYEVKETVLTESPEETMADFSSNLNIFSLTLDKSDESDAIKRSIAGFNNYFAAASDEDKREIAVLYKANKIQFDRVLLYDYSDVTGLRITSSDAILLVKHSLACIAIVGGSFAVLYGETALKMAGAVIALVGFKKAKDFHNELVTRNLNTIGLVVDGIMGTNNKNSFTSELLFHDDDSRTLPLNTSARGLISFDSNKTEAGAVSYFKDQSRYNYYANKVNVVIQWLNDEVIFADFSLIPTEQLPSTSATADETATAEIFGNIQFSVDHPNLTLVSASLQSDGQMNMRIKITGTPATLPIESFLYFSYNDEFSSFSGKLPIHVSNSLFIGQSYQGGIIGYILLPGDPGYIQDETHGLIVAPNDQTTAWSTPWGCPQIIINGADGTAIGTGLQNTIDIVNGCNEPNIAARICYDLVFGGYSDWFLPSFVELEMIRNNCQIIGGFVETYYWTSSERMTPDGTFSIASELLIPGQISIATFKTDLAAVRAVRNF